MKRWIIALTALTASAGALAAGGDVPLEHARTDIQNTAALQRGAKLYVSYCMGCHSLDYMRYSRLAQDLELTEEQVVDNLIFGRDKKIGDLMTIAMAEGDAEEWFGAAPPDLSVVARSRGVDWIYTFLKTYYVDQNRPSGWNNVAFENTSMPNPFWELQGIRSLAHHDEGEDAGPDDARGMPKFEVLQAGSLSEEEFDELVTDLTTFLEYAGEPAALKRAGLGIWVLLYLAVFTFIAYLVKKEYWRDVH